jgi:CHASE3 domain sensor protein
MSVSGTGQYCPSPEDKEVYRKEFVQGLDLFKRALDQYQSTSDDEQHKKDAFANVMKEALTVLNQTASVVCSKKAQEKEQVLQKDFNSFLKDGSSDNIDKLNSDIQQLRKSVS